MRRFASKWNVALQHFKGAGMLSKRLIAIMLLSLVHLLATAPQGVCQTGGTSPVYNIREGRNEISLFERFSTFVQHSAKIKRVMDFDEEVISIQTVEGNPQQFRIYALKSGVTTVTIVDEFEQAYSVEVLVRGDVRHLESFIRRLYPNDSIAVEEISDTAVRLDGWVSKPENISEIQAIAEQFYPDVLNHMKTGGVQQVLLKCTVLEVQRTKLRRLGMNFSLVRPDSFLTSTPGPITPITALAGGVPTLSGFQNTSISYGFTRPNSVFQGFVQAMLEEGMLKSHATPMIVTHNGRPANFLSGGETPVPISAGLGVTGVEFREFGIQMNAVPYILGNGRVRLEVETIIRDRDFANSVVINGTTTTAFKTNSANTQVEMNFGEALVIAGLVAQSENSTAQKIPFFGELPYIGTAFSRKAHQEGETELIILITPEFVAPMPAAQLPSSGPGSFTDSPVDRELFFHGLLEVPKFGDPCDQCQGGMIGGPCQNPNCPNCLGGENCIPGNVKTSPAKSPMVVPSGRTATPALPASSSTGTSGKATLPSTSKKGSTRSAGSGLISPTMR
jgi:pilus assembly protein CpaC